MTNIKDGSDKFFFHRKGEIVDYILKNVLSNKNRKIGTEWELFFLDCQGRAINRKDGQKAFVEFKKVLGLLGYKVAYIYEQDSLGKRTIFGLNVDELGTLTPEVGHQFEFSCSVCDSVDEIREKNEVFFDVTREVAARLGYVPVFKGHVPDYVESTEGSYRSRSVQWRAYFEKRFGSDFLKICETLDATSSTQITLDSGSEKFHEFFQVLLLIEPVLTLYYSNSARRHIGVCRLPPSHIKPVIGAWHARSPKTALEIIVDRLMQVEVPFLPDTDCPQIYKAEPLVGRCPPTVEDLMLQGRLNEKTLNNVGGFLLSRPALRRFSQGVIEMRGVDSQNTPEKVAEVAQRVKNLVYNDRTREELLEDYAHLSTLDLYKMHYASTLSKIDDALDTIIGGTTMANLIEDILCRSEPFVQPSKLHPLILENRAIA